MKKTFMALATIFVSSVLVIGTAGAATSPDKTIIIADFEGNDYGKWKTTGNAFADGPTDGSAISNNQADAATGTLSSPEFTIERGYINFQICGGNFPNDLNVQLIVNGKALRSTSGNHNKNMFWFSWDVLNLKGSPATIVITDNNKDRDWGHITVDNIEQSNTRRGMNELYRPQFHITAQWGHMNDPNGLIYYDGEYHVFHQWSPWHPYHRNKCWGHLVSTDLIHWKHLPHALTPIGGWGANGSPAFSGSAVVDHNNTSGFQTGSEKPIVLIWTAIGTGQFIAYSNDRGRTFTWYEGNPVIPQKRDDRDPMVRWNESLKKWVMALPEQENGKMGIHVSSDLKNWTRASTIPGVGDCPDYYKLPVDGDTNNEKWILYGGHGIYKLGSVNGTTFDFDPKAESHNLWLGHQYATQTFNNTPDGRRIMLVWVVHNTEEPDGLPFTQMLSFPTEIKLKTFPEGIRAAATPIKEIELLHKNKHSWKNKTIKPGENLLKGLSGMLFDIRAEFEIDTASEFGFRIRGDHTVSYDVKKNSAELSGKISKCNVWEIPPMKKRVKMQILVDRSLIEAFYDEGRAYLSTSFFPDKAKQSLEIFSLGGDTRLVSMDVYELNSAWDRPATADF